jgi:hypothetical protein
METERSDLKRVPACEFASATLQSSDAGRKVVKHACGSRQARSACPKGISLAPFMR